MKVIVRPHDPTLDGELPDLFQELTTEPHLWIGVGTAVASNNDPTPAQDVEVELLRVVDDVWSIYGHNTIKTLEPHETLKTYGGGRKLTTDQLRGRVRFTDVDGTRWELWQDGTRNEI